MPSISKQTFRRISTVVRRQERTPIRTLPPVSGYPKTIPEDRWFCTTGPLSTAVKSGSDITTYKMKPGSATARPCLWDKANLWYTPDQNATDQKILNCTVITSSIGAGKFFKCTIQNGQWVADLSTEC